MICGSTLELTAKQKKIIVLSTASLIAGVCVWRVAIGFDWAAIWAVLRRANWAAFAVTTVATIVLYWLLRAARWAVLLRGDAVKIPFAELYLYTAVAVGFSTVTPFQAGEALKVELLRKHGATRASGYGNFVIERALDLFVVLLLALAGVQNQVDASIASAIRLIFAAGVVAAGVITAAIFLLPHKSLRRVREWARARLRLQILLPALLLTVASWLTVVAGWAFAVRAVGVNLEFGQALVLTALTTLLAVISFVPGAIGVSEISAANILINFGFAPEIAGAGAVVLRAYALAIVLLAAVHLIFFKRRKTVFELTTESAENY